MYFSFDDAMRWTGLRDELRAGMSKLERVAWHKRASGSPQDFCPGDGCKKCPLYTPEWDPKGLHSNCMAITATRLADRGLWRQARDVCNRILAKFAEG